jgi:ribosomal protein S18 acetylase RimI-like enzyme
MDAQFRFDDDGGPTFTIRVEEVERMDAAMVRTVIEIDLQTFAEGTFSAYTAAVFLQHGRLFVLRADDAVIGTCVCMRSWDDREAASIVAMGIRPGWRGRGLGQRFVSQVLAALGRSGVRTVALFVAPENRRALSVYRDVGFHEVDERVADPRSGERLKRLEITLPA